MFITSLGNIMIITVTIIIINIIIIVLITTLIVVPANALFSLIYKSNTCICPRQYANSCLSRADGSSKPTRKRQVINKD